MAHYKQRAKLSQKQLWKWFQIVSEERGSIWNHFHILIEYTRIVQCSTAQYSIDYIIEYSRVQQSIVEYSRVQYSTAQYSMVQYNMLCCAVLCYTMLYCAMLCYTIQGYNILYDTIRYYTRLYYTIQYNIIRRPNMLELKALQLNMI